MLIVACTQVSPEQRPSAKQVGTRRTGGPCCLGLALLYWGCDDQRVRGVQVYERILACPPSETV